MSFPYICSNIPAVPTGGVYISQLKRCYASSGSPSWILLSFIDIVSRMNTDMFGLYWLQVIILFYVCTSVQDIFRHIFLSNCWWQKSDIWSQASYRYTIEWVAFLDPSDSYFLFADLVGFLYTLNIYANCSSHFSQQLLMAEIWYLVTSFI